MGVIYDFFCDELFLGFVDGFLIGVWFNYILMWVLDVSEKGKVILMMGFFVWCDFLVEVLCVFGEDMVVWCKVCMIGSVVFVLVYVVVGCVD